ncbi:TetR/AcrR family transcriptional regulator [Streptomyces sp. NPDC048434]|uniref:TetR/AcrR family transcriptional regulator n=1 Tax=Streptomyces sp. NPDC048434 TaxID=3365549 RepID=UPI00371F9463
MILDAAAEVFAEQGYDRASMREIARVANITTPVLYDHFQSKVDLYMSTVELQANLLIAEWQTNPESVTPEEVFNSTTRAFFLAVSRSDRTWQLLFADRPSAPEAVAVQQQIQSYATEALVAALHQLPVLDHPMAVSDERFYYALAEAIKGAGHSLIGWWQNNKDVPIDQIAALSELLLWKGLASMIVGPKAQHNECNEPGDKRNGRIV